jgi:hypothetical protein
MSIASQIRMRPVLGGNAPLVMLELPDPLACVPRFAMLETDRYNDRSNSGTGVMKRMILFLTGRHRLPCERRSDVWHKLAWSRMPISGAVLSPRMAGHGNRLVGCRLPRLEDARKLAQEGRPVSLFYFRPAASFEERSAVQGSCPPVVAISALSSRAEGGCKMTLHNADRFDIFSLV